MRKLLTGGRVWRVRDDVNTDLIIAGKYKLSITNIDDLSRHAMEGLIQNFSSRVKKGDFIVAGNNFGCGSSREQAPVVLKHLGIEGVIAKSFARIFYRNSINIGLPAIECKETDKIQDEDYLEVNLIEGYIKNLTREENYKFTPMPAEIWKILSEGGLVSYVKKHGGLPW